MRKLCFIVAVLTAFSVFAEFTAEDEDGNEIRKISPGCFITIIRTAGKKVDLKGPVDINGPSHLTKEESLHFPFISNGIDPGPMLRDTKACIHAGIYIQSVHTLNLIRYELHDHVNVFILLDNPAEAPAAIDFTKSKSHPMTVTIEVTEDAETVSPPLKTWLDVLHWQIQDKKVQVVLLDSTQTHSLARVIAARLALLQPDADFELHRIIGTSPEHGPKQ